MLLRLPIKGKRVWRNGRKTATAGKASLQAVLLSNPTCTMGQCSLLMTPASVADSAKWRERPEARRRRRIGGCGDRYRDRRGHRSWQTVRRLRRFGIG